MDENVVVDGNFGTSRNADDTRAFASALIGLIERMVAREGSLEAV